MTDFKNGNTMNSDGTFFHVKVGDTVTREFYGEKQKWVVTAVDKDLITVGLGWTFDRRTGFEEDPDLGLGVKFGVTISRLIHETEDIV